MSSAPYVIVGGGMAAAAAIRGIRQVDAERPITVVSAEPDPPYKRPPLSKGLWTGMSVDQIWSGIDDPGVTLRLGRTVTVLDPATKSLLDDHGERYAYDKLLVATGSTPRRLPLDDDGPIIYFRTLADYRRLRERTDRGQRFAVIGGGFIGSELAAALASNGKQVTLIFPGTAIGDRLFPPDLARSLNEAYRSRGVELRAGETIVGVERRGDGWILRSRDIVGTGDHELPVDGVVAGIGTRPNVDLARAGGLMAGAGILVDRYLRTSLPDIYAAGDVANVWMPALAMRRRVEHEDQAKTMGRAAGRAMAGQEEPYDHLPFFYSDLFDQGYEAVGELDPRLDVVADWTDPFHEGTIYYLRDGRVRGVLLWNIWDRVEAARELIRRAEPVDGHHLALDQVLVR